MVKCNYSLVDKYLQRYHMTGYHGFENTKKRDSMIPYFTLSCNQLLFQQARHNSICVYTQIKYLWVQKNKVDSN